MRWGEVIEVGTVRLTRFLQYLQQISPRVVNPEEAIAPVTDWYAPDMAEEAFDFALHQVLSQTLLIGGGCTDKAVCENKPHRWLAR